MQDLLISAERLKKELSLTQARRHIMRFGGAVTQLELAREQLEDLTAPLLERTVVVTKRTIDKARAEGVAHFDDVLARRRHDPAARGDPDPQGPAGPGCAPA